MSSRTAHLPDSARVWIFGSERPLRIAEIEALRADLDDFIGRWTAHGADLRAATDVLEDRFVLVAVDEESAAASGCSIDAMVRHLAGVERHLELSLLDGSLVFHRDEDGRIVSRSRAEFRELARAGRVSGSTSVFDLTLRTLGEVRAGLLERAAADSWHRQLVGEVLGQT